MPAKDYYHENVKNALIKDGWTITDDPFHLRWGKRDMYVDLGAEKLIAAEKQGQRVAIEIKTFRSLSEMTDLEQALGQYLAYRSVMSRTHPDRLLYLAIREEVYADIFDEPIATLLVEDYKVHIVVFKPEGRGHIKMDTLEQYRQLIRNILIERTKIPFSDGDIQFETVFDSEQDRYLLMILGREPAYDFCPTVTRRVHGCLIHIDIIDGKIWIQRDGTEEGVASELLREGVPKERIVLGFRSEALRKDTEFAIA